MSAQLPFGFYARRKPNPMKRAEAGATAAAEHADRVHDGWSDCALIIVRSYCRARPGAQLIAEEVIDHAHRVAGLPLPPDTRAWGSVILRAKREGLIRKVGYRTEGTANASPKPLWEVA